MANKKVLRLDLNSDNVGKFLRSAGSEFQTDGAMKLKERLALMVLHQGRRSPPSPMCRQAKFLLSGSGDSDSPAGSVPLSWVMYQNGTQRIL